MAAKTLAFQSAACARADDCPVPGRLCDGAALADPDTPGLPLPVLGIGACGALGLGVLMRRRKKRKS